jgi:hypothetical protein
LIVGIESLEFRLQLAQAKPRIATLNAIAQYSAERVTGAAKSSTVGTNNTPAISSPAVPVSLVPVD